MPRIPDTELQRLKREVSLEQLVRTKGIELSRHGQDLIGLCPFHADREPSLVVTPSKNLWHCLGACQTGGSVIDWVMKSEGVSFRHAVELLRNDASSLAASAPAGRTKSSTVQKLGPVVSRDVEAQQQLREVIAYYHATLEQDPKALAYLEQRGLQSAEMLSHFQLGYSNRTLGYRLPQKNRRAGAEVRSRLHELGILRSSGHEHFAGSLVIPVIDAQGAITEVYGRKVNDNLRAGTPKHLYLPGPHRGVFNELALGTSEDVILCESLIDALTFWCAGFRNVTASYGVEGFVQDHLDAFERHAVRRVLIAYDRDAAGDGAATKLADELTAAGLEAFRVQFPRGMDANAYACQVQPAEVSLGVALQAALWMGKGEAPKSMPALASPAAVGVGASIESEEPRSNPSLAASSPGPTSESTDREAAPAPRAGTNTEIREQEVVLRFGDRRWRIRGLDKNNSYEQLRVNVLCGKSAAYHVDTFDLYSARHRTAFLKQAADELGVDEQILKTDLGKVLLELESLQEQQLHKTENDAPQVPELNDAERSEALALLSDPKLLDRILEDFDRCGVVGEQTNKLVGYLAAVSRKLDEPLAVIIQSSSAAGKSALMEAVLSLMPTEERVHYSAMTGQSLFYMGETDLKHKILAIAEEEGAERAAYALKLLQSEGELTIASTGKDPQTGKLVTHTYRVEGPVMIFLTTTAVEIDDELLNRCIVLTVNEARQQTRAIHQTQRHAQTLAGLLRREQKRRVLELHQNAQRLLRPLLVANPFAERLTFLDDRTRTRRDHMKYLTLIRSIALLHQHQRPIQTTTHAGRTLDYIEVTVADIETANELAAEVLGRSLDELPPQTRRLLGLVEEMVSAACERLETKRQDYRFTRRDVREYTGWGNTQLKVHLHRLEELEYLLVHSGSRGQRLVYELCYAGEGNDGSRFLSGLVDPLQLGHGYDEKKSGSAVEKSGPSRPQVGGVSGPSRGGQNDTNPSDDNSLRDAKSEEPFPALIRTKVSNSSYPRIVGIE